MAFANKPMVSEWISRNPGRMTDLLEANIAQNLQTALENIVLAEYHTPAALRAAYTAALNDIKATGNTAFINALNQAIAALPAE